MTNILHEIDPAPNSRGARERLENLAGALVIAYEGSTREDPSLISMMADVESALALLDRIESGG